MGFLDIWICYIIQFWPTTDCAQGLYLESCSGLNSAVFWRLYVVPGLHWSELQEKQELTISLILVLRSRSLLVLRPPFLFLFLNIFHHRYTDL